MLDDQIKEQDKYSTKELSQKALENLIKNEELRKKTSEFLSLQPEEKFLGLFDSEKHEPLIQEFDGRKIQRFQYMVKNPNTGQENFWRVSKRASEQIDAFLIEGHNLLKIQRLGLGNDPRCYGHNLIPLAFTFFSTNTKLSFNMISRNQLYLEAMEKMLDQRLDPIPKWNCNHIYKLGIENELKSSE